MSSAPMGNNRLVELRDVVKAFVRTKTPDRCILVSDISGQAGQPPGRYTSDFCDVELLGDGWRLVGTRLAMTLMEPGTSAGIRTCST